MSKRIYAFYTATSVNPDGEEEYGWIDRDWSRTELHDSRNYVRAVINLDDDHPDLQDEIIDAVDWIGPAVNNGDGAIYGEDEYSPLYGDRADNTYTYAIHFKAKYHNGQEWVEEDWDPEAHGFTV